MDIVFTGRHHTDVPERFRTYATGKLAKIEKLDHKAIRVDVEVEIEPNPRQSARKERVELTITTKGPAIRAEAAAADRFSALDLALAKLESRLRRACDRRKDRYGAAPSAPAAGWVPDEDTAAEPGAEAAREPEPAPERAADPGRLAEAVPASRRASEEAAGTELTVVIEMQGDGPLVVREKTHVASPMTIDQALFEMELIGHDFFLFTDTKAGLPCVVYRRRGYQYGLIRLVAGPDGGSAGLVNGSVPRAANLGAG
jgi:ribosomal subunit interface protein